MRLARIVVLGVGVLLTPCAAIADSAPPEADDATTPSRAVGSTHDCSEYYSPADRRFERTGQVFLTYDVGPDGVIGNVTIVKSSGHDTLDAQALACVHEKWRNTIALTAGKPVASPGHKAAIGFWLDPGRTAQFFYDEGLGIAFTADSERGWRNAVAYFSKAIAMDPGLTDAYYQRGLAYQRVDDQQSAAADFAKAGKSPPTAADPAAAH